MCSKYSLKCVNFINKYMYDFKLDNSIYGDIKNKTLNIIKDTDITYKYKIINGEFNMDMLLSCKFVPNKIIHILKSNNFKNKIILFEKIKININYIEKDEPLININRLLHICNIMYKLNDYNDILNVEIFYIKYRKELTEYKSLLCANNVNSGFSVKFKYVCIFRNEEIEKVLFHELIHFFDNDTSIDNITHNKISEYIINKFGIIDEHYINEAYTDYYAILYNTLFMSYYLNTDFYELFKIEILFSLFQTAKILANNNILNFEQIYKKENVIKQNTHGFSYYILKSAFLLRPELLNKKSFDNINLIIELIESSLNNKIFINIINYYINIILNEHNNMFIFKTMRMSSLQL
jgi:hypothetical protein